MCRFYYRLQGKFRRAFGETDLRHVASRRVGYGPSKAAAAQVLEHFASDARRVQEQEQEGGDGMGNEVLSIVSFHPGAFYTPNLSGHFATDEVKWDSLDLPAHLALWLAGPKSGFLRGRYMWANWDVDELLRSRTDWRLTLIS